jgi:hypothetical protein
MVYSEALESVNLKISHAKCECHVHNLHMIIFMYVLIISKGIKIRHMENHMYWEEKNTGMFCI